MRRLACLGFAAVLIIGSGAAPANEARATMAPLHFIPTENPSDASLAGDARARVRLSSPEPQALAVALGLDASPGQSSFEYVFGPYPQLRGPESRNWLEATFVIDFNEPAFEPLRKELESRATRTTGPQLVAYVAGLMEPSADRGWDLASVVARRREGDCSEHAVLTTALARLQGIPSRVALGVALVSQDKNHAAFGHAWAEVLEDGEWKVADAALFDLQATVRYLPVGLMEDEGMGYGMDLVRSLRHWVDRVVVLGP